MNLPTMPAPAASDALIWLATLCTQCHTHYYRAPDGAEDGPWHCPGCDHTVTRPDLDTGTTGDLHATHLGTLCRGIHPSTTYTYARPDGQRPAPETMTISELVRHLGYYCMWSARAIDHALDRANRSGSSEQTSGYGLRTVITRTA